jgi:P27 family predicted phage terminase small subunit
MRGALQVTQRDLNSIGLLTMVDRAALAACCQSWGRWVEAERKPKETPPLLKTPAGYIQVSPWLTIANKERELMARYMADPGLTPSSRSRLAVQVPTTPKPREFDPAAEFVE